MEKAKKNLIPFDRFLLDLRKKVLADQLSIEDYFVTISKASVFYGRPFTVSLLQSNQPDSMFEGFEFENGSFIIQNKKLTFHSLKMVIGKYTFPYPENLNDFITYAFNCGIHLHLKSIPNFK